MSLTLRVTSSPTEALGTNAAKAFSEKGGTIGRSRSNDWVLPDPKRYVSSRHASIDYHGGGYYLTDISTNGVYFNDSSQPIASGSRRRLNNGDRLRIGDYELLVDILEENQRMQAAAVEKQYDGRAEDRTTNSGNVELATVEGPVDAFGQTVALVSKPRRARSAPAAVTERAPVAPEPPRRAPAPAVAQPRQPRATLTVTEHSTARSAPTPSSAKRSSPAAVDSLKALLTGAGLDPLLLRHADASAVLQVAGQVIRETMLGMIEALQVRAELKNKFRLAQTTIQPGENNPLKFSAGIDEALEKLLVREGSHYLGPVDAIRECFRDMRIHQTALLAAMQAAVDELMQRFDPDELQDKFDRGLKRGGLLGATNKMKYWELYGEFYQVVIHNLQAGMPHVFSEEFARAYEAAVDKLRADRRSD